ncbi:hypothetical protein KOR42_07850 [Thalassoglobus neptunius]|uniref:PHP domain protein n=1 Tax=Thalassoglobus neptunius TaxID=1938619 RepID=A0A5C5X2S9_9PLAN|nr:hypothetical protein [Thalassoglobus neptunius]TWT57424.1 hypothetical protein KOR42_07850 [Thalassoglobus neptunius]
MPRLFLLLLLVTVLALTSFGLNMSGSPGELTAQSTENLKWYKGNLHTHSHWSDGDDYLENIGLWYRNQGYDFLVFTDHNVLADSEKWVVVEKTKGGRKAYEKLQANFPDWIEERTVNGQLEVRMRMFDEVVEKLEVSGSFLLIQGEEISDSFHRHPIHMNVSNVEELIVPRHGNSVFETMQNNVDAVVSQRKLTGKPMIIHLNHPNFGYAVSAEDIMKLQGEKFFEVYNGHPGVHNTGDGTHASTERIWDIVLSQRLGRLDLPLMYGLAVDDGHNYHSIPSRASEPGRGWVMVQSASLTPENLIESLESGQFYSSSGVTLNAFGHTEKSMSVEVQPEPGETYTIEFIGTDSDTPLDGEPILGDDGEPLAVTHRYSSEIGRVLQRTEGTSATYEYQGTELYVRAKITSSADHPNPSELGDKKSAWVQPIVVSAK